MTVKQGTSSPAKITDFVLQDKGLTIVEYAIAAGLVVASVAASFVILGTTVDAIIVAVTAML